MQKYRPDTDEYIPVIKIKELNQERTDENSDKASINIPKQYIINDGDIIFSWSGTLMVKIWVGGIGGLNQHLFKVTSDKYDKWFCYLWTLSHMDKFKAIAKDKATTMGHIKRSHITESKVLIPSDSDLECMGKVIKPIINQMIEIKIQNRKLSEIRDTLLPKLMSGEIRVPIEEV
jgi:type I restriction enzyme S subunit